MTAAVFCVQALNKPGVNRRLPVTCSLGGVLVCALVMTLGACTPSRTYVLELPPERVAVAREQVQAVRLQESVSLVEFDKELAESFREELIEALAKDPAIGVSDDAPVTLSYRFVLLSKGDVPVRVGSGLLNLLGSPFYGLGDGAVGVEVMFAHSDGSPAGRILSDGPIAGIFGSAGEAVETSAKNIAEYTKQNYTMVRSSTHDKK